MLKIWFKNPYIEIGIKIEIKICKGNRNQVYKWRVDVTRYKHELRKELGKHKYLEEMMENYF